MSATSNYGHQIYLLLHKAAKRAPAVLANRGVVGNSSSTEVNTRVSTQRVSAISWYVKYPEGKLNLRQGLAICSFVQDADVVPTFRRNKAGFGSLLCFSRCKRCRKTQSWLSILKLTISAYRSRSIPNYNSTTLGVWSLRRAGLQVGMLRYPDPIFARMSLSWDRLSAAVEIN